jgi:hypothetical protein
VGIGRSFCGAAELATAANVRAKAIIAMSFFIVRISKSRVKVTTYESYPIGLSPFSAALPLRFRESEQPPKLRKRLVQNGNVFAHHPQRFRVQL